MGKSHRLTPKPSSPRKRRMDLALLVIVATGGWMTLHMHLPKEAWHFDATNASLTAASSAISSSQPGAAGRPGGFADLKFDVLHWLRYAEAEARQHGVPLDAECGASFGAGFLKRFVDSRQPLCGPGAETRATGHAPGSTSQVACYAYPYRYYGVACESRNLVLNATAFMGMPTPPGEKEHHKYLPEGREGSVQLDCRLPYTLQQLQATSWALGGVEFVQTLPPGVDGFTASLARERTLWFKSAATQVDPRTIKAACQPPRGDAVQHPVMFVSRLDPSNPYIHSQSVVQAFLTLAALQATGHSKPYSELQIILADWFKPGPFMEVWRRVSAPHPVIHLAQQGPQDTATCFKHAVHAHYVEPGGAFLGYGGLDARNSTRARRRTLDANDASKCPSTLLMAFAHWQRHLFFELLPPWDQAELENSRHLSSSSRGSNAHYSSSTTPSDRPHTAINGGSSGGVSGSLDPAQLVLGSPTSATSKHKRLNVVWLSRYMFGKSMEAGAGLTDWQKRRQLNHTHEGAIVGAIQQAVLDWNNRACAPPEFPWWQKPRPAQQQVGCTRTNVTFDFRYVEMTMEDLYPDQAFLLFRTGVLVGVHGAALNNMMWMRPHRGAVVEIRGGSKSHHRSTAIQLGHGHFPVLSLLPSTMARAVEAAMDYVASKY